MLKLKKFLLIIFVLFIGISMIEAKNKISKDEVINSIKKGATSTKVLLKKVPIDYYQDNDSLLHYAVQFRKRDVVELLVNRKILISRKGGIFYGTALQDAIYYGHLGIASYLLQKGSLVNVRNSEGDTALHIAARNGYLDMVEQLIARGASKNMPNGDGKTAYSLIPHLAWDSRKKLQNALASEPVNIHTQGYSRGMSNRNVNISVKKSINIIDKKSKLHNSNIGVDVNVHRIKKF